MKRVRTFTLPNGKATSSTDRYCREWNRLAKPVAKVLNCDVIGMDPGIHLAPKSGAPGFQLPVSVAQSILALLQSNRRLRRFHEGGP